mgnify:CR=1 FL=1
MDMEEIRYLLGGTVFARAKAYTDRIQDLNCEVAGNGVRHLSADVRGGGRSLYQTQVWLRENGSFVSASCDCPYNQNGDGTYCKHIGALLLQDAEKNPPAPEKKPESIFINRERRYFAEGKQQNSMRAMDFGKSEIGQEALVAILESAIGFALNFDLLMPPYEENKRVTVDQFNTKMDNSKFVTGKRLGYDFEVEDI